MWLFIRKILVFVLPVLIILFTGEVLLRAVPNDYQYKNDFLNANSGSIETLILGSSHTYRGLNPIYFSTNTFNAAYKSQSMEMDYLIFKKFDHKLKKLKNLILPVSYPSFFYSMENEENTRWRIFNYTIYYDLFHDYKIKNRFEILNNLPITSFKKLTNYYFREKSNRGCDSLGFEPFLAFKNLNELKKSGTERVNLQSYKKLKPSDYKEIFDRNTRILDYFINYCNSNNIKLYILTTPVFYTYYENVNQEQLDVMHHTIDSLTKGKENIMYVDLLEDKRFKPVDFNNADHLSKYGAKKLSLIMDSIIRNNKTQ